MLLYDLTLLLVIALLATSNGLVLGWAALLGARRAPALFWAAGSLLMALAAASAFLIPASPGHGRGVAFNVPILLSHACWLLGILHFLGRSALQRWILGLLAGGILAVVWLSWVAPDRELRIFLAAGLGSLFRIAGALALLVYTGEHSRWVARVVAAVMLADGVVLLDHAFAGLHGQVPGIGNDPHNSRGITWLSMLISAGVTTPLLMLLGLSRLLAELRHSAHRDSLTGLLNRRGFFDRVQPLLSQARREHGHGAVLMLDIDRFKRLNDRFGHRSGDAVLCALGGVLRDTLRGSDTAVRWGGEEFCVLLPQADQDSARRVAERLRQEFSRRSALLPDLAGKPASVSVGFACGHWRETSFEALQQQADSALYEAKRAGRDRSQLAVPAAA